MIINPAAGLVRDLAVTPMQSAAQRSTGARPVMVDRVVCVVRCMVWFSA